MCRSDATQILITAVICIEGGIRKILSSRRNVTYINLNSLSFVNWEFLTQLFRRFKPRL